MLCAGLPASNAVTACPMTKGDRIAEADVKADRSKIQPNPFRWPLVRFHKRSSVPFKFFGFSLGRNIGPLPFRFIGGGVIFLSAIGTASYL